jgi:branched-chain amino acid aminotransferase
MQENLIWCRGEVLPESKAMVNVLSSTAQFGMNVFEGIRCYWNPEKQELYAFRLQEHLERLFDSCYLMGLTSPYESDEIIRSLKEIIFANYFHEDLAIRLTIFGDGKGTWNSVGPLSMFIAPMKKNRQDINNVRGLQCCISSWRRISDNVLPPRAKVGANYINGRYAHLQAKRDGYDLPIFLGDDGKVSEGAGACLFLIKNGTLITPAVTSSILESITRNTLMTLATEQGINVVERSVDRTELYLADEIFLCGSAAEITPITHVDKFKIGSGNPGILSCNLLKEYLDIASGDDLRHSEWRTKVSG